MAAVNDNNRGVGITGPDVWNIQSELHYNYSPGSVSETSGDAMYLTNLIARNMNGTGTIYMVYDIVVGTIDEIRAAAQLHPASNPANNAPNYSFTGGQYNEFRAFNGLLNNQGTGSALVVDWTKGNAELKGPSGLFRAQDVPTLYVRMKNESHSDNLKLGWRRPGDNDGMIAPEMDLVCPRNGQFNTIAVPMSGNSNWSGNISLIKIRQEGLPESGNGNWYKWSFTYIGRINPGS
jgi:hypothetical protein